MSVLEEAPLPEVDYLDIIGEVPGNTDEIGDLMYRNVTRTFVDEARPILHRKLKEDEEVALRIPDEETGTTYEVPLKDLTLKRHPSNRKFIATFKKRFEDEFGEHKVRDVTLAVSIGAAYVVAKSLYIRHKK